MTGRGGVCQWISHIYDLCFVIILIHNFKWELSTLSVVQHGIKLLKNVQLLVNVVQANCGSS